MILLFSEYTVTLNDSFLSALEIIDHNCKGFVVVLDDLGRVIGTLTDGDIRRALLNGKTISCPIEKSDAYTKTFVFAREGAGIDTLIDLFQDERVEFLPILDSDNRLAGLVTRKQLHNLILQCRDLPSYAELLKVDDSPVSSEISRRPWGIYKTTVLQRLYQAKVLQIKPGAQLSLQYHNRREEYWVVAAGEGVVQLGESLFSVQAGSTVFIPKGCIHRVSNTSSENQLIVSELQIGDYFGEDDIVRIDDKYGRDI